jgi:predicted transposase YbfD/YdcC
VNGWATHQSLCLGQVAVDTKSNEITALPKLLQMLDLRGALVTIDARGCQKTITKTIVEAGGDYLLPVKNNQPTLFQQIARAFELPTEHSAWAQPLKIHRTTEVNRDREETRTCFQLPNLHLIHCQSEWSGLKSVFMIHRERVLADKYESEVMYYISSRSLTPEEFGVSVRAHWLSENHLHWCLDVQFREDDCRIAERQAAANLGWFRRVGVSVLRQQTDLEGSTERKMQRLSRNPQLLEPLLQLPVFNP